MRSAARVATATCEHSRRRQRLRAATRPRRCHRATSRRFDSKQHGSFAALFYGRNLSVRKPDADIGGTNLRLTALGHHSRDLRSREPV
jgi:hypothetical protein